MKRVGGIKIVAGKTSGMWRLSVSIATRIVNYKILMCGVWSQSSYILGS
jgi:hypothetical protein